MILSGVDFSDLQKRLIHGVEKVVVLSHRNPDGDAVGASLGLSNLLEKLGHTVHVVVPNPLPRFLKWMKGARDIVVHSNNTARAERIISEATLMFALDFNDLTRIREYDSFVSGNPCYKVLIDHHPHPGDFANLVISNTESSSTAELVYHVIHHLGLASYIDSDSASCIYAGIMTDTGNFSYNSSRPDTFMTVARLLEFGIEKNKIYDAVFDNFSFERMRLMGFCLDRKMVFLPEYQTAYIALSQDELKAYDFKVGDSEGFVNLPLSIKGVRFSALFIENKDRVKVSFRSKGSFAVNVMASTYFQGGGHRNASGGESFDSLEETVQRFEALLPEFNEELHAE